MRLTGYVVAAALFVPAARAAQDQPQSDQQAAPAQDQQQQQPQPQQAEQPAQDQQPAEQPAQGQACQQKKPSFARDAGSAAARTGGQIAGGAVAGPVGAAVGGVAVDHVGRAVKHAVKGKHRSRRAAQAQQCATQQAG